jgi:hypothetical protein
MWQNLKAALAAAYVLGANIKTSENVCKVTKPHPDLAESSISLGSLKCMLHNYTPAYLIYI